MSKENFEYRLEERSKNRRAIGLAAVAFILATLIHLIVMDRFPNSADEYAYLWQAQALSAGHITAEALQPDETFAFFHLGSYDGHRYSRFPPGFSLLLVPGVLLGLPYLINPLLAGLALAGIYLLGCRWIGERAAFVGSLLTLFSPFFLLNAASFHSHPSCLFALTLLALSLSSSEPPIRPAAALFAGFVFGLAVLIRPFTALLIGFTLIFTDGLKGFLQTPRRFVRLLLFIMGGLPAALLLAVVNHAISGNPFLMATQFFDPREGLGFGVHGHSVVQGLQTTLLWCIEGLAYTFFLSPMLLVAAKRHAGVYEKRLWLLLLVPMVGYFFYWNPGGNRYGPRFYFEALLAFTLLTGVGMQRILTTGRYRRMLLLSVVMGVIVLAKQCFDVHQEIEQRQDVFRMVERQRLDNAIVLILNSSKTIPVWDLTRNQPDFENQSVLFGRGRGEQDRDIMKHHPGRTLYYYRWKPSGSQLWPADLSHPETPDPLPDL